MPSATTPATPIAPVSAIPTVLVSAVPLYLFLPFPQLPFSRVLVSFSTSPLFFSCKFIAPNLWFLVSCSLLGLLPTIPSQFKVGSSFATIPDPIGEAAAFFACFDKPEINNLDPANFWGSDPSLCGLPWLQGSPVLRFSLRGSFQ